MQYLQVQKYAKRHLSRSSCYLKPPARCRKAAEVEIWIFLLPPDPRPPLFSLRNAARDQKKTPQDSRWDSHLRPQSPSPAAAAASCTGASRIDRSDISLHPPAAAGEGALLCFRRRMTKGRGGEGHRKGRAHRGKFSRTRVDGALLSRNWRIFGCAVALKAEIPGDEK